MGDRQACSLDRKLSREVSVCFNHLHVTMDFYGMKSPPFDVKIGVSAPEALRGCFDLRLQQVAVISGSQKTTLSFEYVIVEVPVEKSFKTDSEDFTSDSDAGLDVNEYYEGDLAIALA